MTPAPILVTAGLAGAVVASFATTLGLRLSVAGAPSGSRSACDGCHRPLGWLETTPLIAYAALRGRCRTCGHSISRLHPMGEAIGLAVCVVIALVAPNLRGAALAIMAMALLALSVQDALSARINVALIQVVGGCALFLAYDLGQFDLLVGLAAGLFWGVVLSGVAFLTHLRTQRIGLGRGDIWLFAALAIWLGLASVWMMLLAPALILLVKLVTGRLRTITPGAPMIAIVGLTIGLLLEAHLWPRP